MLVHDASKSTMKLSKKWPQEDDNTGEASEAQAQREDPVQSARRGRRTAADPTDTPIDASSAAGTDVPFQPACRATSNCTMWDAAVDAFEYPPSYHPRYQPTSVRMQPVMVQTQRGPVAMIPMHQQLPQPRAHYAVQTEQVTTIGTALGGAGHVVDVPVHAAASAPAVLFTAAAVLHPAAGGRLPAASGGVTAAPVAVLVRELLALS